MTTILGLTDDVLRRMPDCYRTWQLLRLTCVTLYIRLGDYHETRDIKLYCDTKPVKYGTFIRAVCSICKSKTWSPMSMDMIASDGPMMQWCMTMMRMNIYKNKQIVGTMEKTRFNFPGEHIVCITIDDVYYRVSGAWAQFIYDELPTLATCVRITHKLTPRIIDLV